MSFKKGLKYDDSGKIAMSGKMNIDLFNLLESLDYYNLSPPKSLGLEWVNEFIFPIIKRFSEYPLEDLLHTFSKHFASQIASKHLKSADRALNHRWWSLQ